MTAYLNNNFLSAEEAKLHVSDLSMTRGYAIFDFFRTVNGVPLFMHDHLDRFYASAEAMHIPVEKSREELVAVIYELIKRSSLAEAGIRLMQTGGYSTDSYHPATPNLLITCNPVKTSTASDFEKGFSIITHEHQRELPHVKSINYLMAVWLQPLLKEKQADDILYYNKESITEFPRSNVFIVTKENKLVTPAYNMLKGITRKNIISLAAETMPVEERNITVDELAEAEEIFLTATTKKIIPVVKLNGKIVADGKPGPITRKLYEKFLQLEQSLSHLVSL
jgi:branched-chain amino acid aminotransferase